MILDCIKNYGSDRIGIIIHIFEKETAKVTFQALATTECWLKLAYVCILTGIRLGASIKLCSKLFPMRFSGAMYLLLVLGSLWFV